MLKNTPTQYGAIARALHWSTALLFFALFFLGLFMTGLDKTNPLREQLFGLYISLGLLVLGLTLIRVIWKILQVQPVFPQTMTPAQIKAAKSVYGLLYLLLLFIPISGYIIVTTSGKDPGFFNLLSLPNLIGKNDELHETAEEIHEFLAYTAMLLVIGHLLMALKHHFIDKDNSLKQMLGTIDK